MIVSFILWAAGPYHSAQHYHVEVVPYEPTNKIFSVSPKYLSFGVDADQAFSLLPDRGFPFDSPEVAVMARALSPSILRFGGASQDNPQPFYTNRTDTKNTTQLSFRTVDRLRGFASNVSWDFVFGLNLQDRIPTGNGASRWNAKGSAAFITHELQGHWEQSTIWALGNEPDLYPKSLAVSPTAQVADCGRLQNLLRNLTNDKLASNKTHYIVGPDVSNNWPSERPYLETFVKTLAATDPPLELHALTHHHYYENSATANLSSCFEPSILDSALPKLKLAKKLRDQYLNTTEIWLGEVR